MTIKEAMKARHTVRKYTDKGIPDDLISLIKARIEENNEAHGLNMTLVTGNSDGLSGIAKLLLAKGVNNYIILAGSDTPDLDEKLGYCGSDVMLYVQTLGLNTWWVGGMFNKKGAAKNLTADFVRVNGVIAVGYGQTQGVQHKSKTAVEISRYNGVTPEWFANGVDALLYQSGYERLKAVLTQASNTSIQKSMLACKLNWIGTNEKKGSCHMLVNEKRLKGWID